MKARIGQSAGRLMESFWRLPALMVLAGIALAFALLGVDHDGMLPVSVTGSFWLYNGGGSGARTLFGAIVSSPIGVAGTVFSITIAALSLAAGQLGPRLLRNFTRDRGNQFTLGAFLGTFSYALMVLRSVRTQQEGAFTPQLSLSIGVLLALGCVATLVYFGGYMASRNNVDMVIELVSADVAEALDELLVEKESAQQPDEHFWENASVVVDARRGYLQQLDEHGLANGAAAQGTALRLLVRRGDYLFPGAPIALMVRTVSGAAEGIRRATALAASRGSRGDPEQMVRQLVEVAVRALSPGINDPHTGMSVLDRLGAALCSLAGKQLPNGVHVVRDHVVLVVPNMSYSSLSEVMLHMIRQNSEGSAAMLIKLVAVLTVVAACEPDSERQEVLEKHVALVRTDALRTVGNPPDRREIESRLLRFGRISAAQQSGNITANALLGSA